MRKTAICALLLLACAQATGENVAAENVAPMPAFNPVQNFYTQPEIDAKMEQLNSEVINLREVSSLRVDAALREAQSARAYIDRVLLIALVMLAVVCYLFFTSFRHQLNSQGQRMRRLLKEGETMLADIDRVLSRPDVENYRASRKLNEIKSLLKESSDRVLPQLSVRDVYAVSSDPHLPALLFVQAKAIRAEQAGDWHEAAAHWQEVISLDPNDPDNYLHLAHTYRNLSRMTTGEEHERLTEQSLSYYQEYAKRTKGLHEAFANREPPFPAPAPPAPAQAAQGVQPVQSVAPAAQPSPSPWRRVKKVAPVRAVQPAAVAPSPPAPQPVVPSPSRRARGVEPVQSVETQPATQPAAMPAQGVEPVQSVQLPAQAPLEADAPPASRASSLRKPLFAGVKRTAGTIGGTAERTISRGWGKIRSAAQGLVEARQKKTVEVFSAGATADTPAAIDAAISSEAVAQADLGAPPLGKNTGLARRPAASRAGVEPVAVPSAPAQPEPAQAELPPAPAQPEQGNLLAEPRPAESASPEPPAPTNGKSNGHSAAHPAMNGAETNGKDASAPAAPAPSAPGPAEQAGPQEPPSLERANALFMEAVSLSEEEGNTARCQQQLDHALETFERLFEADANNSGLYKPWALALVAKALSISKKNGKDRTKMFRQAADKLMEGNLRQPHMHDFVIASVYALAGDERRCKKWLEESQNSGKLDVEALNTIPEFAQMRRKPWFNKYLESRTD